MTAVPLLVLAQRRRDRGAEHRRRSAYYAEKADQQNAEVDRYEAIFARAELMADVAVVERLAGGRVTVVENAPNGSM